jgi:hypothetical protein
MVVETYLDYLLWGGGFPLELLWDLRECWGPINTNSPGSNFTKQRI